jgi:hypothetical protein
MRTVGFDLIASQNIRERFPNSLPPRALDFAHPFTKAVTRSLPFSSKIRQLPKIPVPAMAGLTPAEIAVAENFPPDLHRVL